MAKAASKRHDPGQCGGSSAGAIRMKRCIDGESRSQSTLFPETLDEYIAAHSAVRVIDAFIDRLDLGALGFSRVAPSATGRQGH